MMFIDKRAAIIILFLIVLNNAYSQNFVGDKKQPGSFTVVSATSASSIYTDENESLACSKRIEIGGVD